MTSSTARLFRAPPDRRGHCSFATTARDQRGGTALDTLVVFAARYDAEDDAADDYDAVSDLHVQSDLIDPYDAVVISRHADGKMKIVKKPSSPPGRAPGRPGHRPGRRGVLRAVPGDRPLHRAAN